MRGLKIFYRNGSSQNINTDNGNECATVNFEPGDTFIGMTCILSAPDNKKPRRMGITILRNDGSIFESEVVGNSIGFYP